MTRMHRPARALFLLTALGAVLASPLGGCGAPTNDVPPLAVVIVIDQLRTDTLARLTPILEGGIGRLLREGRLFVLGSHEHATSETAPGHATLLTGVPPSKHGITGNRWYTRPDGLLVTCAQDPSTPNYTGTGGISARFLEATTLGEWLKQASPKSRVVSIGGKDRSAALMAGRNADAVFFYDPRAGRFTTSAAWAPSEPELLLEFDRTHPLAPLACAEWDPLSGAADRPEAAADDSPWEPEKGRVFPHRLPCPEQGAGHAAPGAGAPDDHAPAPPPGLDEATQRALARELPFTPFFDTLTLGLAEVALDAYELGRDAAPDLLLVSLAGTDYIGHRYGPESQELLDQIRRLDLRLDLFLRTLDERLGKGRVLVVLTSDHGVADSPESKPDSGVRRVMDHDLMTRVEARLVAALGPPPRAEDGKARWLLGIEGYHVFLAEATPRVLDAALAALNPEEIVDAVFTAAELGAAAPSDPLLALARASFWPGRSGDLLIRPKPGWLLTPLTSGSDHGTPWEYDRQVPILFSGPGIRPGLSRDTAPTTRVAPTLATRLGVPIPAGVDPEVLLPGPP